MRRLLLLLLLAAGAVGSPASAEPPSPELLAQLRQGGQVIFLRHAFADEGIDEDPKTLGPCQRQRRLSPRGRGQAAAIGQAFAALGIPVTRVVSSPYCRAMETAGIAFGPLAVDHRLRLLQGELTAEEKAELPQAVRRMLATAPAAGGNTVLVSHNSKDALGLDLDMGEAAVVRPEGGESFTVLAKVKAQDWRSDMPVATDAPRPAWIVAEYPLGAAPGALVLATDGAVLTTLADGELARLDPYIGTVARSGTSRRGSSAPPVDAVVTLSEAEVRINQDGQVHAAGAALRLLGGASPVRDLTGDGSRLWLSRPAREAVLLIRRP